jgi:hypothetical protein
MEADWIAKRATLRWLLHTHPQWTQQNYAAFLHCSVGWVKRWKKRLLQAPADDLVVLHSRSRARRTPFPAPHPAVVERIVQIRQAPPENLKRIPGSRTILYYLHRDPDLQAQGLPVPRSARTIWKIMRKLGLILDPPDARHQRQPEWPRFSLGFASVSALFRHPAQRLSAKASTEERVCGKISSQLQV